jgi:TPP-dependent pyruvate/acetoin dehydrogenase alpha subunit
VGWRRFFRRDCSGFRQEAWVATNQVKRKEMEKSFVGRETGLGKGRKNTHCTSVPAYP